MKHENIKERCVYQVSMGGDKKAVVKVVRYNPDADSWTCKTESGKEMKIKDPKRFLKEVKEKAAPEAAPKKKGPVPKEKPFKPQADAKTVNPDEEKRLLENVRITAHAARVAQNALELGLGVKPSEVERTRLEAEDAKNAAALAGIKMGGGSAIGMMSAIKAAFRLLQEEGRPMRARELSDLAIAKGYCESKGKTPWSTLAAQLTVDINEKGEASKFYKVSPGLFDINPKYKEN